LAIFIAESGDKKALFLSGKSAGADGRGLKETIFPRVRDP
jgi:hypothetical protein